MKICICGGGNLGHVVSGYLGAKSDVNVGILTRHPERWVRPTENNITQQLYNKWQTEHCYSQSVRNHTTGRYSIALSAGYVYQK